MLLVGFRVALNVVDSNVIDVGYAGVIGADRIADGDQLYGEGFSADVERGDTYGPVTYLAYLPFEQALPWSGRWDDLPAAHGAALAFDLITLLGLVLLGRRLRPGREGRELGAGAGLRVGCLPVRPLRAADELQRLVGRHVHRARDAGPDARHPPAAGLAARARGAAVGLGAAAKFAPLLLAPLFARGVRWGARDRLVFVASLAAGARRGDPAVPARRRPARAV